MTAITIKERLAIIETQLKTCQKTLWILLFVVAGKTGIDSWPQIINLFSSLI